MQVELKIRVGMQPYLLTDKRVSFNIIQQDIDDFISKETKLEYYRKDSIKFNARVSIASTNSLMSTVVSRQHLYSLLDNYDTIKQVDIDILDYPDDHIGPKHLHILNAARYKSSHIKGGAEVVRVYDHRQQRLAVYHSNIKLNTGAKYRVYVDDILMIERHYSYDLDNNQQLEELLYLELPLGTHIVSIENLNRNTVYITDLMVNKQVYAQINSLNQSFEIN